MSILRADFFPKTSEEFKERTLGGAAISIGCIFFALLLFAAAQASLVATDCWLARWSSLPVPQQVGRRTY